MDEIFRITPDRERAADLFEMAKERIELVKLIPKGMAYRIVEEYYEIAKELLTAIMYIDGHKTLSHVKLIEYFSLHYKGLDDQQLRLIDDLRKQRHGIVYYGKKVRQEFLINHEEEIKKTIKILLLIVGNKLK